MTETPYWRGIETAPKDGTPVLLYYPEGEWNDYQGRHLPVMAVMRWDVEFGLRAGPGADYCWFGYYDGTTPGDKPTHWMPLPAPPKKPEPSIPPTEWIDKPSAR